MSMKQKIGLKQKITDVFLVVIFLVVLSFSPIQAPKANAWTAFAASSFKQMLENIKYEINGMILGMLKKAAVASLNSQVDNLVGGGNGNSPVFITNWQNYLINQPIAATQIYMNDYLSQMTTGRGTITGYTSEGFSGNGSYVANLKQNALAKVNSSSAKKVPHITYEGNPNQMFNGGHFKNMSSYLSGVNNPWAFNLAAQNAYQKKLEDEKSVQQAKAVAYQGFKGSGDNGANSSITNPGSLVKTNIANVQNIGNMTLASATHPGEVISSLVFRVITRAINQGFSSVQLAISRQTYNVQNKLEKEINKAIKISGPGARF